MIKQRFKMKFCFSILTFIKNFINYKAGCDSLFGKIRNHIHKLKEEDKVLIDGELTLEMDIALKQRVIVNQLLIF